MICRNHIDVTEGVRRCSRCGSTFCGDCLVTIQNKPYCATCKHEHLLDVRSGVAPGALSLATIWKRFGAIFVDGLIVNLPMYVILMGFVFGTASAGEEPNPLLNLIGIPFMFVHMIYEGLMFQLKDGQTLGKMALKVKVVRPDGSSITTGQAWGRAAMKLVLGCLWFVDYIPAFFTREKTTLHDLIAGTRVVEMY